MATRMAAFQTPASLENRKGHYESDLLGVWCQLDGAIDCRNLA